MENRGFRTTIMAGIGLITAGGVPLLGEFTDNSKVFIFSIAIFVAMIPFAVWGIVNLIRGEKNG